MLSATLVLFSGDLLTIFSDALHDESVSHVLIIPVLVAYIIFRKRKVIQAAAFFENRQKLFNLIRVDTVVGGFLLLASLGLYWHAPYTMMSLEYHVIAMILFLASCTLILFNSSMLRQLIFPLLLLSLLFPPAEILYNAGSILSVASSTITYSVLRASGYPVSLSIEYENPWLQVVQQDGTPITFSVDPACSGIYSLMGFLVFALFIAYLVKGRIWKKTVAFSLGFPLIYSLNIIRLIATVLVGYYFGETTALDLFHVFGGWFLVFLGTLLLLTSFRRVFSIHLVIRSFGECPSCENSSLPSNSTFCFNCSRMLKIPVPTFDRTDLVRVLVVLIAAILVTAIQTPILLTREHTELVVSTPTGSQFSTEILPQIDNYSLVYVMRDREFETYAKQDLSLIYSYIPDDRSEDTIWVLIEIASIRTSLHRTEACLVKSYAAGERVEELALRDYQLVDNPPTVGRFCVFHYTRSQTNQTVIYWIQTSPFSINSTIVERYVKISLVAYPASLDQITDSEKRLLSFAESVTDYWRPISQWSQVALVVSKSRYVLLALPFSLSVGAVLFSFFQTLRDKKADERAYQKLPQLHKQIVDAISHTQRSSKPTFTNIRSTLSKISGRTIESKELHELLLAVEKNEVVKSGFVSVDDYPYKIWKTGVSVK
jgi:exosortase/archaeosortase family protein